MKRLLVFGLSLGLVAALSAPAAAVDKTAKLFADENVLVGSVTITGGSPLQVLVELEKDLWCMTALHADAATTLDGIPTNNKGNPQIGQFEVNETFAKCKGSYSFELKGDGPIVAVHLEVWDMLSGDTKTIYSNESTDVVAFNGVAIPPQAALIAYEPKGYDNCETYKISGEAGSNNSAWDVPALKNDNLGDPFYGAKWIWKTQNPEFPNQGEWVTFKRELQTPGWRTGGTIKIAADNGYRVSVGGTEVSSSTLTNAFPPDLADPPKGGVYTTGWQTPKSVTVPGEGGDVMMTVVAVNEKAWDPDYKEPPDIKTTGIGGQPIPVGTSADNWECPNPGALLFKVTLDYYGRSETAWAANKGVGDILFGGGSWATYIDLSAE